MDPERHQAEQMLTQILNRALKNVPLVKLDAVDEVIRLFSEAIELMESNLIVEDDEDASGGAASAAGSEGQSKLLALAQQPSTPSAASVSTPPGSDDELQRPLVNKAVAGLTNAALTVDYSSPSSKTRSLGAKGAGAQPKPAGSTGLGLGLKGAGGGGSGGAGGGGGAGPTPVAKQLGLHGGHKPSSRATTGLNALAQPQGAASPVSPPTPESSEEGAGASGAESGSSAGGTGPGAMLKNKMVAKLVGAGSREYPSPKLGPRSLSGMSTPSSKTASPSNPAAAGLSLPVADALGRDGTASGNNGSAASGAASPDADDDGPEGEDDSGDLIRVSKKDSVFARVKQTLPVTASPKQISSSLHLLELATNHGLQSQDDDDLTLAAGAGANANGAAAAAPAERPLGPGGVLSALPTGLSTRSNSSTPKPAYLRRLDSPDTHHGQLLAAKSRLQLLLNRGLQVADKVRVEKVPEIKAALEKALAKLEASLVQPQVGPQ